MVLVLQVLAAVGLVQVNALLAIELRKQWRRRGEWMRTSKRKDTPADLSKLRC